MFPTTTQVEDWYQILRKETLQPADADMESEQDGGYSSLDSIISDAERVRADSFKGEGPTGSAASKDSIIRTVVNLFRSPRKTSLSYPQVPGDDDKSWDDDASRWSWPLET